MKGASVGCLWMRETRQDRRGGQRTQAYTCPQDAALLISVDYGNFGTGASAFSARRRTIRLFAESPRTVSRIPTRLVKLEDAPYRNSTLDPVRWPDNLLRLLSMSERYQL